MDYGLCCLFYKEPIKFKTITWRRTSQLIESIGEEEALGEVLSCWDKNLVSLQKAFDFCADNSIAGYRISSDLLPQFERLRSNSFLSNDILEIYRERLAKLDSRGLTLSMHPGQHVNLGSPHPGVVESSISDLSMHFFIAEPLHVKEINIHLGGAYGDPSSAKERFKNVVESRLSKWEIGLLTIENDELNFDIDSVLALSEDLSIPVTYDIHHHRCHALKSSDSIGEKEAFLRSRESWNSRGYQHMHISSPKDGYTTASKSRPHHDYINIADLPDWILEYDNLIVDIEAKAKECAIFKLRDEINSL